MEILSQSPIFEQVGGITESWLLGIFIFSFIGLSLFFAFCLDLDDLGIICGLVVAMFITGICLSIWPPKEAPTGRSEYKVILDETYPATQLYENYEVVGQDGKIWIIQDKEVED